MDNRNNLLRWLAWLPNAITACRYIFAALAFAAMLHNEWRTAFWLFCSIIVTDFLDGLAAKQLHAQTKLGAALDKYADATSVIAGLLGLAVMHHLAWYLLITISSVPMILNNSVRKPWWPKMVIAVSSLFIIWTGILWYLADLAFGWFWYYVPLTLCVFAVCALFKRHRIRAWLKNTS